jgi:hypothetical protein
MITAERLGKLPPPLIVAFAIDCAEHVLPIFEAGYPDDPRPRAAIRAARDWIAGTISEEAVERAIHGAARAAFEPRGNHAVTGYPGWWSGLTAIDATTAAEAAGGAARTAIGLEAAVRAGIAARVSSDRTAVPARPTPILDAWTSARSAAEVARDASRAAAYRDGIEEPAFDYIAPNGPTQLRAQLTAIDSPIERAWQEERLAALEAGYSRPGR